MPAAISARRLDEVHADRLRGERHGARGARVHLEHEDLLLGDGELHIQQADDSEGGTEPAHDLGDLGSRGRAERLRRQHAGGVARVHAGLLDVLHDSGDVRVLPVAQCVDVDLDRALEEAVDEGRALDAFECAQHVVG